jgi:hypothetical protein
MAWTFTGWTHETPTIRSKSKGYYEFTLFLRKSKFIVIIGGTMNLLKHSNQR